jgi:hypothetical protein
MAYDTRNGGRASSPAIGGAINMQPRNPPASAVTVNRPSPQGVTPLVPARAPVGGDGPPLMGTPGGTAGRAVKPLT